MTLRVIFSILNNLSLRRNICVNIRKFTRENKPLFWQKWTPDVFFLFQAAMLVFLGGTPTWRLHTKLYKFMWNILSNNSSTEYCTDLTPGRIDVERWNKRFATVRSSCDVWCGVGLARALFPHFWYVCVMAGKSFLLTNPKSSFLPLFSRFYCRMSKRFLNTFGP